jgi:hypothetical protein
MVHGTDPTNNKMVLMEQDEAKRKAREQNKEKRTSGQDTEDDCDNDEISATDDTCADEQCCHEILYNKCAVTADLLTSLIVTCSSFLIFISHRYH